MIIDERHSQFFNSKPQQLKQWLFLSLCFFSPALLWPWLAML
jgi:hypothetical protein